MKPHLRITLATLLAQNRSQREIERATGDDQIPPPRPPAQAAASRCEVHREFIEAQLRLKRNATAIYQDLVDRYGFDGAYNSVKRFVAKIRTVEPRQFDRPTTGWWPMRPVSETPTAKVAWKTPSATHRPQH